MNDTEKLATLVSELRKVCICKDCTGKGWHAMVYIGKLTCAACEGTGIDYQVLVVLKKLELV